MIFHEEMRQDMDWNLTNIMPVVFAMDDLFAEPGYVAIWSMLKNSCKEKNYEIIILHSDALSVSSQQFLNEIRFSFSNCRIRFLKVDDRQFGHINLKEGITVSSVFRLMAGELFPQYDKCLYLDSDIIVFGDITGLYEEDMEDAYIGAVKDAGIQYYYEENRGYADVIGIADMREYINSGVLVMNLAAIRRDGMCRKFLKYINEGFSYLDQDILNKCCQGHVKYLPLRYNLFRRFYNRLFYLRGTDFTDRELEDAGNLPVILHYAEGLKPWDCIKGNASDVWWEYAERVLPEERYRVRKEKAEQKEEESDWRCVMKWAASKEQVAVFGFTAYGREVVRILHNLGVKNIIVFCDNALEKQELQYEGVGVKTLAEIRKIYPNASFINTSQSQRDQVIKLLIENGYGKENIWSYHPAQFQKSGLYYAILDKKYYKDELKLIIRQETGIESSDYQYMIKLVQQDKYKDIRDKYFMREWVFKVEDTWTT